MANSQFTSTSATELDAIVYEIVDPRIKDLVDKSAVLWNLAVEGKGQETNEKGVRLIVETDSNPAFSWFGEGGSYQAPGRPQYLTMNVKYSRFNIVSQITRDVLEHKDASLVAPILTRLVSSDTATSMKELNRESFGDGTGTQAVVSAHTTASTTTLTTDVPFRSKKLIKNGKYEFIAASAGARSGAGETSTTYAVGDVIGSAATFSSAVTATGVSTWVGIPPDVRANDLIVSPGSYGIVMHGLDYIVNNTGTFQGQSRTANPKLKSIVNTNSGTRRAFSVAQLEKNLQDLKQVRGTEMVKGMKFTIVSNTNNVTAYNNIANGLLNATSSQGSNSLRRFDGGARSLDLGFNVYSYKGIEWVEDVDCPEPTMYVLNLDSIQRFKFKDFGLLNTSGLANGLYTIPAFDSTGAGTLKDSVMYVMTFKGDLGSPDPAHNVKYGDLYISADDSNLPSGLDVN